MLYIMHRHNRQNFESVWHVGEKLPTIPVHTIMELQADGDEGEHIKKIMGGGINRLVQHYYGDLARTIFLNL